MTNHDQEPALNKEAFICPYCNAYSNFKWGDLQVTTNQDSTNIRYKAAKCDHCSTWTLWTNDMVIDEMEAMSNVGNLIYPPKLTSPLPHIDLPETCSLDFQEARSVLPVSPRASAALLRLCIQKLCKELGGVGNNINEDIAKLVKNGLDQRIQKALDVVRVTGNNAVHPGSMDLTDDVDLVLKLFKHVNRIVEEMITKPNEIDASYENLPEGAKQAIERRDQ